MKKKKLKRRPKRRFSWRIKIMVHAGRFNEKFSKVIYFSALNGGEAKAKALPKIQGTLCTAMADRRGSPKVDLFLDSNRKGTPSYKSFSNKSFFYSIMKERSPSRIFCRLPN